MPARLVQRNDPEWLGTPLEKPWWSCVELWKVWNGLRVFGDAFLFFQHVLDDCDQSDLFRRRDERLQYEQVRPNVFAIASQRFTLGFTFCT